MCDIAEWLDGLGLGRYAEAFVENEIDLPALPFITEEDLKEIGVALGARRRLLAAIAEIGDASEPAMAVRADKPSGSAEAERRQLTVMFCDLVGSTALSGHLDPEEMRDIIKSYQNAVTEQVTHFRGHVAKYMGDGVLAYFGWPEAHEDDAESATRAGLSILRRMDDLITPTGHDLDARVGVATGLVVVGDMVGEGSAQEEAVVGETPNLAARLQGIASPGELVISAATRRLLGDLFELKDLGLLTLKGVAALTPAFAVLRERSVESRFEARQEGRLFGMVGRDQELALLMERWRRAKTGEGQLVLLTGEAGIGKSRLTRAAIDEIGADEHIRISYQCSPYHSDSPFYPVIQQLTRAAHFEADDGPAAKLDKLETLLAMSAENVGEVAPLLADVLGIDAQGRYGNLNLSPPQQRSRTLRLLSAQIIGLARRRPVLFVVEDAHWIDPTTLELIEFVIDQVAAEPVLILLTARPTFEHGFASHPIVTRLALNRLGHHQIVAIINRLTDGKALPAELVDEIVSKTDGVPLFVEELTKNVLESGMLRESEDAFLVEGSRADLSIPSTLHDSLMARLDRLQPVKEVAQTAACIGREFEHSLMAAVSPLSEANLNDALDRLIASELVFRRGVPPDARYTFKHALVRDAAYESLLKARRQQLHMRLLDVLEASGEASPEILAHHATAAGLIEKAIDYWQRAGSQALARPAYMEAIGHLGEAIRLVQASGTNGDWQRRELELQIQLGQASIAGRGYAHQRTVEIFDSALRLVPAIDEPSLRFAASYGRWASHHVGAEHSDGLVLAQEILDRASGEEDDGRLMMAHRMVATSLTMLGEFPRAHDNFEKALTLYHPEHQMLAQRFGHEPGVAIRSYYAIALWCLGYPDKARQLIDDALTTASRLDHINSLAYALFHAGLVGCLLRDATLCDDLSTRLIELSAEHDLRMWGDLSLGLQGWVRFERADPGSAEEMLGQGLLRSRNSGTRAFVPLLEGIYGRTLATLGRPEAVETSSRTVVMGHRGSERWCLPELHRLNGEVRGLLADDPAVVETEYNRALATAKEQNAKSWELRAAVCLARLWREQGERAKALDLLSPILGWFTEGSRTRDLKEAGALSDSLS